MAPSLHAVLEKGLACADSHPEDFCLLAIFVDVLNRCSFYRPLSSGIPPLGPRQYKYKLQ
jgi:hypothetical protein